jgi:hypothetical protein
MQMTNPDPKPPRRPHRLLPYIASLFLGLTLTLLTAWLSPWASVRITHFDTQGFSSETPELAGEFSWDTTVPAHWPRTASLRTEGRSPFVDENSLRAPNPIPKRGPAYTIEHFRFGLPFRSMGFSFLREYPEGQRKPIENERGHWMIPHLAELPLIPLFPGFLLNTILNTALTCALIKLPSALRHHKRRGAGNCPNCNYPRTGFNAKAPCPECGTAPIPK